MSQDNVELVRRWYQLLNAGDLERCVELLAGDFELIQPSLPDAGVYRGPAGFRKWVARLNEAWGATSWDPEEFIDAGEYVVVRVSFVATGAHTGIEQRSQRFQTIRVTDGRIKLATGYSELAKALAAVGLTR